MGFCWYREKFEEDFYFACTTNRTTNTLLPIVQKYVAPGSIIHTDKWRAYDASRDENSYLSIG